MRCFISAPMSVDIAPLRTLLQSGGANVISVEDLIPAGTATEWVTRSLAAADVVLVVLPAEQDVPAALWFEAGAARGLGKRVLFIDLGAHTRALPFDERDFRVLMTRDLSSPEFGLHLSVALGLGPSTVHETPGAYEGAPRSPAHGAALQEDAPGSALALEHRVWELFARSADIVRQVPPDRAADMVVWLGGPQAGNLNPLLVELKRLGSGGAGLGSAVQQLRSAASASGARAGLVVYTGESPGPAAQATLDQLLILSAGPWPVFAIHVNDLAQMIEHSQFTESLARACALAAHS